jgi:hypothetical protein
MRDKSQPATHREAGPVLLQCNATGPSLDGEGAVLTGTNSKLDLPPP